MRSSSRIATRRSISIGTDLKTSSNTWQKARPWFMNDNEGLNTAKDNAQTMTSIFKGKTVAVFGVPAPFTGTCTHAHYPPYKQNASALKEAGVDTILCYSVTDPYAMQSWATGMDNDFDQIQFVADVDGEWATEMELDNDYAAVSLSVRSKRFSMLVQDGIVVAFQLVEEAEKDAEVLLEEAQQLLE